MDKQQKHPCDIKRWCGKYNATKQSFEADMQSPLAADIPVICRLDMLHSKTFTSKFLKPYDEAFYNAMQKTLESVCRDIHEIQFGFTTSDEISLLFMREKPEAPLWRGYRPQKMCSTLAAAATLYFNRFFAQEVERLGNFKRYTRALKTGATFDCRCFSVPAEKVDEYFVWRQETNRANAILKYQRICSDLPERSRKPHAPNAYWRGVACVRCISKKKELDAETPLFDVDKNYIAQHTTLSQYISDSEEYSPNSLDKTT